MHFLYPSRLGEMAAEFLDTFGRGRVLAVFERGFYLQAETEHLIFIGRDGLPPGPLTVLVSGGTEAAGWPRERSLARRGEVFWRFEGSSLALQTEKAALWQPEPLPPPEPARLRAALSALSLAAPLLSPQEGLAPLIPVWLGRTEAIDPSFTARPGRFLLLEANRALAALRDWLDGGPAALGDLAAQGLIGLGPGLTPAGDDALGGALMALRLLRENERLAGLDEAIQRQGRFTHLISRAHLRAARRGLTAEPFHEVLRLLGRGSTSLTAGLRALAEMGHSSGWDALTGAVAVLAWKLNFPVPGRPDSALNFDKQPENKPKLGASPALPQPATN